METIDKTTTFLDQLFDLYRYRYGQADDVRGAVKLSNDDQYFYMGSWFLAFSTMGMYGYSAKDLKPTFTITRKRGTYWLVVTRRITVEGKTLFPTEQMIRSMTELEGIFKKLKLDVMITRRDDRWEYDDGINLWQI